MACLVDHAAKSEACIVDIVGVVCRNCPSKSSEAERRSGGGVARQMPLVNNAAGRAGIGDEHVSKSLLERNDANPPIRQAGALVGREGVGA